MIYANPVDEELAKGGFYNERAAPFYLSPDKLEGDYSPVRFERELRLFRRFSKAGRVLDVGCSTGAFLFHLKRLFPEDYDVLGTDIVGPALEYAGRQGVPTSKESFLTMAAGAGFSAITFWAVLEHLVNPASFLAKAATLLNPGGFCFVLVPNFKSLAVRLLGAKYRYILPQHVNYFTAATLALLARRAPRWTQVYLGTTHFNPLVILKDWRSGGAAVPDQERANLLRRTTRLKQNPALTPARWALRFTELLLGRALLADNLIMVLKKQD